MSFAKDPKVKEALAKMISEQKVKLAVAKWKKTWAEEEERIQTTRDATIKARSTRKEAEAVKWEAELEKGYTRLDDFDAAVRAAGNEFQELIVMILSDATTASGAAFDNLMVNMDKAKKAVDVATYNQEKQKNINAAGQESINKGQQESVMDDMQDEAYYWGNIVKLVIKEYWAKKDLEKTLKDKDAIAANNAIIAIITVELAALKAREKAQGDALSAIKMDRKKQIAQEGLSKQMLSIAMNQMKWSS